MSTCMDQRYHTGEEIHIGDRVSCHGCIGSVVFVIDRNEFSAGFPEDWSYLGSGFMVQNSEFGLVHLSEADEDLELLARATPVD